MRSRASATMLITLVLGLVPASPAAPATALTWQACTEPALAGLECATFTVPKDYRRAAAGTIGLAMVRQRSTGSTDERIGSLFFNVGGPGLSSVEEAALVIDRIPDAIQERFDIVTWDPRGVGRSAGIDCGIAAVTPPATGRVHWTALQQRLRLRISRAHADCQAAHSDVVPFVGTNNTVRDLDAMRAAVGDDRLTYLGFSYGSRIGYVYAHAYPGRVRAIVEDGSVSPDSTLASFSAGLSRASDSALGVLFQAYPAAGSLVGRLLDDLQARPLALPSGQRLTHWDVRNTLYGMVSYERQYPALMARLELVDTALHGTGADRAAALAALDAEGPGNQLGAAIGAEQFINCLDYPDRPGPSAQDAINASTRAQAPIVGPVAMNFAMQCAGITVRPDPVPTRLGIVPGLPLLIVGTTRDGRTPHAWSVEMARAFPSARLLTYVGAQHVAFPFAMSSCVDGWATDFVVDLNLPSTDVTCPSTFAQPSAVSG